MYRVVLSVVLSAGFPAAALAEEPCGMLGEVAGSLHSTVDVVDTLNVSGHGANSKIALFNLAGKPYVILSDTEDGVFSSFVSIVLLSIQKARPIEVCSCKMADGSPDKVVTVNIGYDGAQCVPHV